MERFEVEGVEEDVAARHGGDLGGGASDGVAPLSVAHRSAVPFMDGCMSSSNSTASASPRQRHQPTSWTGFGPQRKLKTPEIPVVIGPRDVQDAFICTTVDWPPAGAESPGNRIL